VAGVHNAPASLGLLGGGASEAGALKDLVESPFPDPDGFRDAMVIPIRNKAGVVVATTIVDADLYPALSLRSWHVNDRGYVARSFYLGNARQILKLHRVVMCCTPGDGLEIDHVNRVKLDNRRANLRVVTHVQNMANRELGPRKERRLSTRAKPTWHKVDKTWQAAFSYQGKRRYVGCFKSYEEAEAALVRERSRVIGS
jgi:hypothetical protein